MKSRRSRLSEVEIGGESRTKRDARIKKLTDSGEALDEQRGKDCRTNATARDMQEGRTRSPGSGGAKAKSATPKRGTKMCRYPECNLERALCERHNQTGPFRRGKTVWLRPYLPQWQHDFLTRSKLQLTDVLEAVLDSPAMECWMLHSHFNAPRRSDEEGNDIVRSAYDEKVVEAGTSDWKRPRPPAWRNREDEGTLDFLKALNPNIGPRKEERVTPKLRERLRSIGKGSKRGSSGTNRYSDSRFCAYCIDYFVECLKEIHADCLKYWDRVSCRDEVKEVRAIATITRCRSCEELERTTAEAAAARSREISRRMAEARVRLFGDIDRLGIVK